MVLVNTSVGCPIYAEPMTFGNVCSIAPRLFVFPSSLENSPAKNLKNRAAIISHFEALPMAYKAGHKEVLAFIESRKVMGKGLGYIDVHLLVAALLTDVAFWTLDKRLDKVAGELQIPAPG